MRKIKAKVLRSWNANRNPGAKFLPGEFAIVNSNETDLAEAYRLQIGQVKAVSTPDDGSRKIHGEYGERKWTKYYVEMGDGEILGCDSRFLHPVY